MRFLPLLALPLVLAAAPAHAGCDDSGCHQVDCIAWDPRPPSPDRLVADPTNLHWLLPPVCPT